MAKYCICGVQIRPENTYCLKCWKEVRYADLHEGETALGCDWPTPEQQLTRELVAQDLIYRR